jgi:erythronate-4-phosphate dehydrogenase
LQWCLDVWEHEPAIDKRILEQTFIATPHIAGYSVQSKIRGIDMIYRIACEKNIIEPKPITPRVITKQRFEFAGHPYRWQDIVLGVFNPMVITEMMRTILLPEEDDGRLFDKMRNEFNYRYEFTSAKISNAIMSDADRNLLEKFGLHIE